MGKKKEQTVFRLMPYQNKSYSLAHLTKRKRRPVKVALPKGIFQCPCGNKYRSIQAWRYHFNTKHESDPHRREISQEFYRRLKAGEYETLPFQQLHAQDHPERQQSGQSSRHREDINQNQNEINQRNHPSSDQQNYQEKQHEHPQRILQKNQFQQPLEFQLLQFAQNPLAGKSSLSTIPLDSQDNWRSQINKFEKSKQAKKYGQYPAGTVFRCPDPCGMEYKVFTSWRSHYRSRHQDDHQEKQLYYEFFRNLKAGRFFPQKKGLQSQPQQHQFRQSQRSSKSREKPDMDYQIRQVKKEKLHKSQRQNLFKEFPTGFSAQLQISNEINSLKLKQISLYPQVQNCPKIQTSEKVQFTEQARHKSNTKNTYIRICCKWSSLQQQLKLEDIKHHLNKNQNAISDEETIKMRKDELRTATRKTIEKYHLHDLILAVKDSDEFWDYRVWGGASILNFSWDLLEYFDTSLAVKLCLMIQSLCLDSELLKEIHEWSQYKDCELSELKYIEECLREYQRNWHGFNRIHMKFI